MMIFSVFRFCRFDQPMPKRPSSSPTLCGGDVSSLAEMLRGSPNTSDSGSPLNSAAFDAAGVEAPSAAPPYSSPPPRRPSSLARCASAELGASGKAGAGAGGASDRIWGDAKSEVRRITAGGDVRPSMAGGLTARSTASSVGGGDVWRPRAPDASCCESPHAPWAATAGLLDDGLRDVMSVGRGPQRPRAERIRADRGLIRPRMLE